MRDPRPTGSFSTRARSPQSSASRPAARLRSRGAPPYASRPSAPDDAERPRRALPRGRRGGRRDRARGRRRARRAPARRGDDRRRALPPARGDRDRLRAARARGVDLSLPDGVEATAGWFRAAPARAARGARPRRRSPSSCPATCRTAGGCTRACSSRATSTRRWRRGQPRLRLPRRRVGRHRARARARRGVGRVAHGCGTTARARRRGRARRAAPPRSARARRDGGRLGRPGRGAPRAARARPRTGPHRAAEAPERVRARLRGPSHWRRRRAGGYAARRHPRSPRSSSRIPSATAGGASARSGTDPRAGLQGDPRDHERILRQVDRGHDLDEPVASGSCRPVSRPRQASRRPPSRTRGTGPPGSPRRELAHPAGRASSPGRSSISGRSGP